MNVMQDRDCKLLPAYSKANATRRGEWSQRRQNLCKINYKSNDMKKEIETIMLTSSNSSLPKLRDVEYNCYYIVDIYDIVEG